MHGKKDAFPAGLHIQLTAFFVEIVSLDNDFQYPQGALQFVTNLNMECVNYKIQEMNCQSDCQKYLSRWPILRVKHIRYQVIMFERED